MPHPKIRNGLRTRCSTRVTRSTFKGLNASPEACRIAAPIIIKPVVVTATNCILRYAVA